MVTPCLELCRRRDAYVVSASELGAMHKLRTVCAGTSCALQVINTLKGSRAHLVRVSPYKPDAYVCHKEAASVAVGVCGAYKTAPPMRVARETGRLQDYCGGQFQLLCGVFRLPILPAKPYQVCFVKPGLVTQLLLTQDSSICR